MTRQNIVDVLLASPRPGGASAASCANGACGHVYAQAVRTARDAGLRGQVRELRLVGPCHACLRANTGAACSETSTSISSCLLRFRNSISSFSSGVRLSAAFVEPLLRMPCTQRCSVERGMPYSALIRDDGLPFPLRLHDLPLELLLVMTGTIRIGHDDQPLRCHVPHEPVQYIVANPGRPVAPFPDQRSNRW